MNTSTRPEKENVLISFDNGKQKMVFGGDDCIITSIDIRIPEPNFMIIEDMLGNKVKNFKPQESIKVDISLACLPEKWFQEYHDGTFEPKIKDKNVDECSIGELLFAVRHKINNNK